MAERTVSTPVPRSEPLEVKPAIEEQVAPVAPATVVAATPAESTAAEPANEPSEVASTANEPAAHGDDSQITADVKSKIAAVASAGAIDVTTKDGVVEPAGSVPSQEVIDMARLVASNVADVRRVDVSGLMIGNPGSRLSVARLHIGCRRAIYVRRVAGTCDSSIEWTVWSPYHSRRELHVKTRSRPVTASHEHRRLPLRAAG